MCLYLNRTIGYKAMYFKMKWEWHFEIMWSGESHPQSEIRKMIQCRAG